MSQNLSALLLQLSSQPNKRAIEQIKAALRIPEDEPHLTFSELILSGFNLDAGVMTLVLSAIRKLQYQKNIDTLVLQDLGFNDQALEKLVVDLTTKQDFVALKTICLASNQLTAASIPSLLKLIQQSKTLENLDLSHNPIGSAALQVCKNFAGSLDLAYCGLDYEFSMNLIALIQQNGLKCAELNLTGGFTVTEATSIENALMAVHIPARIVLDANSERQQQLDADRIGMKVKSALSQKRVGVIPADTVNAIVQSTLVFAAKNPAFPRAFENIHLLLAKTSDGITLSLDNVAISLAGYQLLARVLEQNKSVNTLVIRDRQMDAASFAALLVSLKKNTTLSTLQLDLHSLNDKMMAALVQALSWSNLKKIDFVSASFEVSAFINFVNALRDNQKLEVVDFGKCFQASSEHLKLILNLLKTNLILENVVVRVRPSKQSEEICNAIVAQLDVNKKLKPAAAKPVQTTPPKEVVAEPVPPACELTLDPVVDIATTPEVQLTESADAEQATEAPALDVPVHQDQTSVASPVQEKVESEVMPIPEPAASKELPVQQSELIVVPEFPKLVPPLANDLVSPNPPKPEEILANLIKTATEKYLQYHKATKSEKSANASFNRGHGDGWLSWFRHRNKGLLNAEKLAAKSNEIIKTDKLIIKDSALSILVGHTLKTSGVHRHSLSSYFMDELRRQNQRHTQDRYTRQECEDELKSFAQMGG